MLPIVRALDRHHRCLLLSLGFLLLTVVGFTGCGKTDSQPSAAKLQTQNSRPLLKFHWLGKQRLAAEANATNFMAIWSLPESAKLEAQTLDKLATAPWRLWQTNVAVSNAPTALLRPLLDDLVQHEIYVEASGATNHPAELVLAIRLPADRAALWQTNLPQILTSLFATNLTAAGPSSIFHLPSADLTMSRSNDWTLLSFTRSGPPPSNLRPPISSLLATFHARLATTQNPYPPRATNYLVAAEMDLAGLNQVLGWGRKVPVELPHVSWAVLAEGINLRTTGTALYKNPLPLRLTPWQLPTNLIHDPLIAFSSARSVRTWVESLLDTNSIAARKIPDQMFSWAVAGYPLQTYFATPQPESTNAIRLVSAAVNEKLASPGFTNFPGRFVVATNFERMDLQSIPFMEPQLQSIKDSSGEFLFGGFIPMMRTNRPVPVELVAQLVAKPDLVYYDWEITGPRVEAWVYIGQTLRLIFRRAQLSSDSAGLKWLQALMPLVGNSATAVTAKSPTEFTFIRTSTIGFNGLELHFLADWLESPRFPAGFHTDQPQPMPGRGTPPIPQKK